MIISITRGQTHVVSLIVFVFLKDKVSLALLITLEEGEKRGKGKKEKAIRMWYYLSNVCKLYPLCPLWSGNMFTVPLKVNLCSVQYESYRESYVAFTVLPPVGYPPKHRLNSRCKNP